MSALALPTLIRVLVMATLTAATPIAAALTMNAAPVAALCKPAAPGCVNPDPGLKLPRVRSAQIPV